MSPDMLDQLEDWAYIIGGGGGGGSIRLLFPILPTGSYLHKVFPGEKKQKWKGLSAEWEKNWEESMNL